MIADRQGQPGVERAESWDYEVLRRKSVIQSTTKNRSEGDICTV